MDTVSLARANRLVGNAPTAAALEVTLVGPTLAFEGETRIAVSGADFDGRTVTIDTANGTPKMILFLAHWCPHCQAEVPVIQDWIDANGMPEGVDFVSVATGIDRGRTNFPPSDWLEDEGWEVPLILDSNTSEVFGSYGAGGFPFWAFVDGDGALITRASGQGQVDLDVWVPALQGL